MAGGIEEWFKSLPFITRWFFASSFGLSLVANFGLINPRNLYFDLYTIFMKLQLWRFVTGFLYLGPLGFGFVMSLVFMVQYFTKMEKEVLNENSADFAWMLIFGAVTLSLVTLFMPMAILGMPLVLMVMYVWCQLNPDAQAGIFGIKFKAAYLPWALAALNVLMGGSPVPNLIGIGAGHLFYFLKYVYPRSPNGQDYLKTPAFMYTVLPAPRISGGAAGYQMFRPPGAQGAAAPQQPHQPAGAWRNAGAGRRLGAD